MDGLSGGSISSVDNKKTSNSIECRGSWYEPFNIMLLYVLHHIIL
jgi:hypothetical protein